MRNHDEDKNNDFLNEGEKSNERTESTLSDSENHEAEFKNSEEFHEKEKEQTKQKNDHDTKKEELKDAFGNASQVGGKPSFWKKKSAWIIAGVGALFLLIMIGGHHAKEEKKQEASKLQNMDKLREAVAARIKREKGEVPQDHHVAATQLGLDKSAMGEEGAYTKEMIARMNAPTSIYESGGSSTTNNSSSSQEASTSQSGVKEATFMGKGADQEFGNTNYQTTSVEAKQVPHPESTIMSGEMIHATLNVAMDSDLPGMVTATVTSPAYSYTGENELIPRGSRLIGQYSSAVLQGQDRIFVMWNRVVLPNGISVDINSPDTNSIGQAGEPADYINRHFWSRFGESILLSILSAGVSNVDVQTSDQYNSAQAYRIGIAESLQASATGTLQQTISLKPTLVRYQGATINVFIAHDLSFYNVLNQAESA